jgi:hypothetical protein
MTMLALHRVDRAQRTKLLLGCFLAQQTKLLLRLKTINSITMHTKIMGPIGAQQHAKLKRKSTQTTANGAAIHAAQT